MSVFQIASIAGIGGAIVLALVHYVLVGRRQPHPGLGARNVRRYSLWERLVHIVLVLTFLILAWTGFYAAIGWGGPMKGYMLMIHTTSGAVFAFCVGLMMVTWAADHAFARHDGIWLKRGGCLSTASDMPAGRFTAGEKIYFWSAGALTLVALLSMLLSMIKVLGTSGQHLMYHVHRWSTLALTVLTIWHAYATVLAKPGGGWMAVLTGRASAAWTKRWHPLWGGTGQATQPRS